MITCSICGRIFVDFRSFSTHVNRSEKQAFGSEIHRERFIVDTVFGTDAVAEAISLYKQGEVCMDDLTKRGPAIGKLLLLMGLKRSSSEERKTERYKQKYTASIQEKYGESITNISQVPEIQKKKEQTITQKLKIPYTDWLQQKRQTQMKPGYKNYLGSEAHRDALEKAKETCEIRYGHPNFGSGDEATRKRLLSLAETISTWEYEERLRRTNAARKAVNHRGGYCSNIERKVQHALVHLGITFTPHIHLWMYNYDLLVASGMKNFLIEVQGDMWHANPKQYKPTDLIMGKLLAADLWAKDALKKEVAEKNGYAIITIWEHEINSHRTLNGLAVFLLSKLKEQGYEPE